MHSSEHLAFIRGYIQARPNATDRGAARFLKTTAYAVRKARRAASTGAARKRNSAARSLAQRRVVVERIAATTHVGPGGIRYPSHPSTRSISGELYRRNWGTVSRESVRRDLHARGMLSRVRTKVPSRDPKVIKARKEFADRERNKGKAVLDKYVFSDEHTVSTDDRSSRAMWVKHGNKDAVIPRERKDLRHQATFKIWGAVGVGYKSPLVMFPRTVPNPDGKGRPLSFHLTAQRYIDLCLTPILRALKRRHAVFQQDGFRVHWSKEAVALLESRGITVLRGWPSHSPDMSPIEKVWSLLNRRIAAAHAQTEEELRAACQQAWDSLSQAEIDAHCEWYAKRCKTVWTNRGAAAR